MFSEEEKQEIRSIIKSDGWKRIEEYLTSEFVNVKIKTKGKSNEEIAREVAGNDIASEKLKKALRDIRNSVQEFNTKKRIPK